MKRLLFISVFAVTMSSCARSETRFSYPIDLTQFSYLRSQDCSMEELVARDECYWKAHEKRLRELDSLLKYVKELRQKLSTQSEESDVYLKTVDAQGAFGVIIGDTCRVHNDIAKAQGYDLMNPSRRNGDDSPK